MTRSSIFVLVVPSLVVFAGCGSAHEPASEMRADQGGAGVDSSDLSLPAPAPAGGVDAANTTAQTSNACKDIGSFYWEVGNSLRPLASGSVVSGTRSYDASSSIEIASASKFLFGAYVVEKFKTHLGDADFRAMTMRSGHVSLNNLSCFLTSTVQDCRDAGHNGDFTASAWDQFDYDGGHFQWYASTPAVGLGPKTASQLTDEYRSMLSLDSDLHFGFPELAGGITSTPASYAKFLRNVISGRLALKDHLGEGAVCTLPPKNGGGSCAAISSPASPRPWLYSWGHWVEAGAGFDGAFSSPGKFGFYPWIDAGKKFYGVVARHDTSLGAYIGSADCGHAIRTAFLTGKVQP